jgi:DNA-binding NtrC family response regulator
MVELKTPALADRREDLPLLEKFLLDRFATQFHKDIRGLTRRAQIVLARHSWPGNIRELENALGNACMMAMSDMIDVEDLPGSLRQNERTVAAAAGNSYEPDQPAESAVSPSVGLGVSFDEHEKVLLADALERSGGNQSEAARMLRISRDRLRYKMAKYNLR